MRYDEQLNNAIVHLQFVVRGLPNVPPELRRKVRALDADWRAFYRGRLPAELVNSEAGYRRKLDIFQGRLSVLEAAAEAAAGRSLQTHRVDRTAPVSDRYTQEAVDAAERLLGKGGTILAVLLAAGVVVWALSKR